MNGLRITVIGLGAMGAGVAASLLRAGHTVTVHNRTEGKAAPLVKSGAHAAASVADAVSGADIVVLSLADETAVDAVLFDQALPHLSDRATVVDMSTVSPRFARAASERLAEYGVARVEACVVGNPAMAQEGRLRVFTAGDETDAKRVEPVLDACAQQVRYLGDPGTASVLKLAFNLLLGVQTAGLAEAVALAEAAGIDRGLLLDAIDDSGWRSPVLSFRAGFLRRRQYRPAAFRAALMHKDLSLVLSEAEEHGVRLPVVSRVRDRYAEVLGHGRGDEDAAVVGELPV
jgi:3-hydroxyisobutyrate dehydrogenase-like beta-hydroxyacid dehydrogenase